MQQYMNLLSVLWLRDKTKNSNDNNKMATDFLAVYM